MELLPSPNPKDVLPAFTQPKLSTSRTCLAQAPMTAPKKKDVMIFPSGGTLSLTQS